MTNNIPPDNIPPSENENGHSFFNPSTKDIVAYILLLLGIILLFIQHIYGGLLIGLVAGVYFYDEIINVIKEANNIIEDLGIARSLILAGILAALFISAPSIFIGAAIAVGLRWFIASEGK